jgi:hypothetical protein
MSAPLAGRHGEMVAKKRHAHAGSRLRWAGPPPPMGFRGYGFGGFQAKRQLIDPASMPVGKRRERVCGSIAEDYQIEVSGVKRDGLPSRDLGPSERHVPD